LLHGGVYSGIVDRGQVCVCPGVGAELVSFGDDALEEAFTGRIGDLGPVVTVDEEGGVHVGSIE